MLHVLSIRHHKEFSHSQEVVRFTMAHGANGPEPALLIKSSSLTLKYLIRRKAIGLLLSRLPPDNHLLYVVRIQDDPKQPACIWSIAESEEELDAVRHLARECMCPVFLFNEAVVNVCSASIEFTFPHDDTESLFGGVSICPEGRWQKHKNAVKCLLDSVHLGSTVGPGIVEALPAQDYSWEEIRTTYITNRLTRSGLFVLTGDEGNQQEELALYLVDSLSPSGAVKSPQVYEPTGARELSDVLMTYPKGCFLIESKTLSVLGRPDLPDRTKLKRMVEKHLDKATNQLVGGCRNIKSGLKVTDAAGNEINVARDNPIHCIGLTPDLSLVSDCHQFGGATLKRFAREAACFLHILDPNELFKTVQNALLLSENSTQTSPIMAFDAILIKRWEEACKLSTPYLHFFVGLEDKFGRARGAFIQ